MHHMFSHDIIFELLPYCFSIDVRNKKLFLRFASGDSFISQSFSTHEVSRVLPPSVEILLTTDISSQPATESQVFVLTFDSLFSWCLVPDVR